jgi:glutamate dehydrogenase/leucine dehydrogenase
MVVQPLVSEQSSVEGSSSPDDDPEGRPSAEGAVVSGDAADDRAVIDADPEELVFVHDRRSGLRAGISVHSTVLGPALGGCRFRPYRSRAEAIEDVTRLGRAMTAKASLAGLDLGGGKSVIVGDPATDRGDARLRAFAHLVADLGGRYIVAEDVGTTTADMDLIRSVTPFVVGCSVAVGGAGDPSGSTAAGVLEAMRAVLAFAEDRPATPRTSGPGATPADPDPVAGRHVVVLGVGMVGRALATALVAAGARVTVADIDARTVAKLRRSLGVEVVDPVEAHRVRCDVFAPCALGGVLDPATIAALRCHAVVGSANNQLADPEDADRLADRGILYAPDYLVNAGGLIHVAEERSGHFDAEQVDARVRAIGTTTTTILRDAARLGITPSAAADHLATRRIADAARAQYAARSTSAA